MALALLVSGPVAARAHDDQSATPKVQKPAQPAQPSKPAPPGPPAPAAPPAPGEPAHPAPPPPPPPPEPALPVNVRIDVTITEQQGAAAPTKKTVSLVVADSETGSARSDAKLPIEIGQAPNFTTLPLNVDARPRILDNTHVRVRLVVNWRVLSAGAKNGASTEVTEQVAPILESGKPLIVAQSADPVTDRQVTVEAKATILR